MQHDREAEFEGFVRANIESLHRAAYFLCGDTDRAQDVVQVALIRLASKWEKVSAQAPLAYVRKILHHEAVSQWRRARREVLATDHHGRDPATTHRGALDPVSTWIEGSDLRQAVRALPIRQRSVIVLRYLDDLSEADTARAMGISTGTVKSQAHIALKKLGDALSESAVRTPSKERNHDVPESPRD